MSDILLESISRNVKFVSPDNGSRFDMRLAPKMAPVRCGRCRKGVRASIWHPQRLNPVSPVIPDIGLISDIGL